MAEPVSSQAALLQALTDASQRARQQVTSAAAPTAIANTGGNIAMGEAQDGLGAVGRVSIQTGDATATGDQSAPQVSGAPGGRIGPSAGTTIVPADYAKYGISPAEASILKRESGFRTDARNKTAVISNGKNLGHAFGLGQLVDTNRQYYAKQLGISNPDTLDAGEQLAMFRAYIKNRYGNADRALAWWQSHGWY